MSSAFNPQQEGPNYQCHCIRFEGLNPTPTTMTSRRSTYDIFVLLCQFHILIGSFPTPPPEFASVTSLGIYIYHESTVFYGSGPLVFC